MKLTDEQIAKIMTKQTVTKTVLVDEKNAGKTIDFHKNDGWKLLKETKLNDKVKLTFEK